MQNNNTQGSLSDRFSDFGAAPSAGLWDSIANQLDEKKKRRLGFWWWTSGIAAVFTLSCVLWYSLANGIPAKHIQSIKAEDSSKPTLSTHSIPSDQKIEQSFPVISGIYREPNVVTPFSQKNTELAVEKKNALSSTELTILQPIEGRTSDQLIDLKNDSLLTSTPIESIVFDSALIVDSSPAEFNEMARKYLPPPAKWRIGLSGTWINGSAKTYGPMIQPSNPSDQDAFNYYSPSDSTNYLVNTRYQTGIQLNIARRINRKLWLDGGIACGIFGSREIDLSPNFYTTHVTTWKIDIPLGLQYDLIHYGRFHLTTGIGINSTIPFYKKVTYSPTAGVSNGTVAISSEVQENPLIIEETERSVEVTTGFQYNLALEYQFSSKLFIQVKPIVRYYPFNTIGGNFRTSPLLKNTWWWGGNVGLIWEF